MAVSLHRPQYDADARDHALYRMGARAYSFHGKGRAAAVRWQRSFRTALRRALGLERMDRELAGWKVRARRFEVRRLPGYTREKWYVWTEPGVPLPVWVLKPEGVKGRLPLVLTPHGHNHPEEYLGIGRTAAADRIITSQTRDIAVQAVRQGYLVILPTSRAFGETRAPEIPSEGYGTQSCRRELMHALLAGRTVIGERVWDISRLIDWALLRDDVDPHRIVVTGNSGGGTTSLFAPACDTRVTVAMPNCYFCTFEGSIGSIYHCDCNYVPGLLRLGEAWDVAGLIAPRTIRITNGVRDTIFPIAETRRSFRNLRKIYSAFGVPQSASLYVGKAGHRYYPDGAWPFLRKELGE